MTAHPAPLLLSIDQGTTSSRAILFDHKWQVVGCAQEEFTQHYPGDGWVEHDPENIWNTTLRTCAKVIAGTSSPGRIAGLGIANQRETTILWERKSGQPVCNAIVWQDRRTAKWCAQLKRQGLEPTIRAKTGLLLDPYFSATKIQWMLENVPGARAKADRGQLAFGTVDSFLIWRLTGGRQHLTDATNASRTMLFNIHDGDWDEELLHLFGIPRSLLPEVKNCADEYGIARQAVPGLQIPIAGVAGDQQAALFGQACLAPGRVKSTCGTGCFLVMNTGKRPIRSENRLLTTIGYRLENETTYALEGSIFNAGTAIQWLRDLGVIRDNRDIDRHVSTTRSNGGVYLVPAFTGLGAPHWSPDARGILSGITRDTDASALIRAALESVGYQTHDLIQAMQADSGLVIDEIRVDGGMAVNAWLLQFLADITRIPVCKPVTTEITAQGVAYLAALQLGIIESRQAIHDHWKPRMSFGGTMDELTRERNLLGWQNAVNRCLE
ncbi:MAG: glycerol kinase GlpK [Gammaproteobacteria bacterium]|nr:glycerol kinase GlpK [Gammaproteobacteria bacterium]